MMYEKGFSVCHVFEIWFTMYDAWDMISDCDDDILTCSIWFMTCDAGSMMHDIMNTRIGSDFR